ncbi:MAG: DNA mismatch endonuclease Vsr [Alphaproteobacteria bacterium]|nr:DNA mismatch endonuclease Vsr [Alphaproteobacteria bacterium]
MADVFSKQQRSMVMAGIRHKDTKPEIAVRRVAHRIGLRFRLHKAGLPGRPDLVLPKHNLVIFVHGCFWHQHEGCAKAYRPKSRSEFWNAKFEANVDRDRRVLTELLDLGWRVAVIWECETKNEQVLELHLKSLVQT